MDTLTLTSDMQTVLAAILILFVLCAFTLSVSAMLTRMLAMILNLFGFDVDA